LLAALPAMTTRRLCLHSTRFEKRKGEKFSTGEERQDEGNEANALWIQEARMHIQTDHVELRKNPERSRGSFFYGEKARRQPAPSIKGGPLCRTANQA